MGRKLVASLVMESALQPQVYPVHLVAELASVVELRRPFLTRESLAANPSALLDTELLFTGWGAPKLTESFLASAPNLKAVFVAAGSIKSISSEAFWAADIPIVSAASANAVPVAEFATAQVLLGLKQAYRFSRELRANKAFPAAPVQVPGALGSTVGLVSLGEIGRGVAARLQSTAVHTIAYDPWASPSAAKELGVELVGLAELFERSQVVSLHCPLLPETTGLIDGGLVRSLPFGATLVNTARGAVINEPELIAVLTHRTDLTAVLDVTWPEPPAGDSLLYLLENVVLTPHLSGSMGAERERMGQLVVEEASRWLRGEPLQHAVTARQALLRA
jgi:phosphoglycerate dehydrogenase-like enzyme